MKMLTSRILGAEKMCRATPLALKKHCEASGPQGKALELPPEFIGLREVSVHFGTRLACRAVAVGIGILHRPVGSRCTRMRTIRAETGKPDGNQQNIGTHER